MNNTILDNLNPFESVSSRTTDNSAAALPIGAAAAFSFTDSGAGEAYRPPPGYVLVERELLGRVVKRLRQAAAREREQLRDTPWAFLLRGAE